MCKLSFLLRYKDSKNNAENRQRVFVNVYIENIVQ